MRLFCVAATREERGRGEVVDGEGGEGRVQGGNRVVPALVFFSLFCSFFSNVVGVKRSCVNRDTPVEPPSWQHYREGGDANGRAAS